MVKFIFSIIIFVNSLNLCQGQIFTDTIFSGRSRDIDLSQSITSVFIDSLKGLNLCQNLPFKNNEGVHPKSNVPFLLNMYSKKSVKNKILSNFEALIYTSFCSQYNFMHETYIFELFYENEKMAKECIIALDNLNNFFEYAKKNDVLESKDEFVSPIIVYDFIYKRRGNVVYIFHKILPDSGNSQIIKTIKLKFLNIIN